MFRRVVRRMQRLLQEAFMAIQKKWRWWTIALRGIAALALGILSLLAPTITFLSLVIVFGIYAIIDGALALELAPPRGATVARGLVSIAAGLIALVWPGIGAYALLLVIAFWAIASGILELVTAVRLRKRLEHEWLLGVEGVLSLVFGIVLVLAPLAGAVVLGLWVGAYALVLGGMLLATAFRVRAYLRQHPDAMLAA